MWDCLGKLDIALGLLGFIISGLSLILTARVNSKVNQALERKTLRENPNEFIGKMDGYIDFLGVSEIDYLTLKNPLLNDVANIKTFFSSLPKETKVQIKFIESVDFKNVEYDPSDAQKLRTAIFHLRNYLQKEAAN